MRINLTNEEKGITITAKAKGQLPMGFVNKLVEALYSDDFSTESRSKAEMLQMLEKLSTKETVPVISRPKAIEKINSERTLSSSIGERVNVPTYVFCPSCGNEDTQYIYRGNRYIKCSSCQEKLFLKPAGEVWGDLDEDGNEYHATSVYREPSY